jgi:pyruvate dehydrogenase E1 component beta subunit
MATDIIALVSEKAFTSLDAPPQMVTAPHSPVPFSKELERAWVPNPDAITAAVRRTMDWG